jgi:catechol 2,3-dioxygenase-like lactoylglutathione lyase family enzyme
MDYRLEVVAVPVSDVDAAKAFYERIGYHIDHDHRVSDELRFVQITPPGSCCSIVIGNGITSAPPGSAQGLQVVVDDVEAAQAQLRAACVEVGDVQHALTGRFVFFSDPDGNGWAVQQFPRPRLAASPPVARSADRGPKG